MKKIVFSILFVGTSVLMFAQQKTSVVVTQVKTAETTTIKNNGQNPNNTQNTGEKQESEIILKLENNGSGSKVVYDASKDYGTQTTTNTTTETTVAPRTTEDEIADLDNYIKAIDTKVEWAKNNPEEDKKAKKSGWYDQMATAKKTAEEKKQNLINSKK